MSINDLGGGARWQVLLPKRAVKIFWPCGKVSGCEGHFEGFRAKGKWRPTIIAFVEEPHALFSETVKEVTKTAYIEMQTDKSRMWFFKPSYKSKRPVRSVLFCSFVSHASGITFERSWRLRQHLHGGRETLKDIVSSKSENSVSSNERVGIFNIGSLFLCLFLLNCLGTWDFAILWENYLFRTPPNLFRTGGGSK